MDLHKPVTDELTDNSPQYEGANIYYEVSLFSKEGIGIKHDYNKYFHSYNPYGLWKKKTINLVSNKPIFEY